jgi:hypothetical protein
LTTKKLKKLAQLEEISKLYDCKIRCLPAINYIVINNITDPETIASFFDSSISCANNSIREFICSIVPEITSCCVCKNLEEKIKTISVLKNLNKDEE